VTIGATSAGSPGQPLQVRLLEDWSLRLSVVRDAFPGGGDFTGTGVAPEVPVVQTVNDLLAGRDAALERARAYLAAQRE
jgi:C-terminal processing protease CtpA/Prc